MLCGSGAGFWVFSLGILHGMWLIVKGDFFLTNISHILLKPPGLVRNQMTARALRFGRRRGVRARQPCMSPQQPAALLCQSSAPNAASAGRSIVCMFQTLALIQNRRKLFHSSPAVMQCRRTCCKQCIRSANE